MKAKFLLLGLLVFAACSKGPADGEYTIHLLTTNDVHGSWFDQPYVGERAKNSLYAVNYYVDSVRTAVGAENVLLVDAGDCLQGDNGAYYFNYVDTITPHLFPRLVKYMGYDAVTVGNHDVETGHAVYDRVAKDLQGYKIPFLGGNAIRNDNGEPYFQLYKMFKRQGLRIAVLGYTNANMKAWLNESLWSGMTFESLIPLVQEDVDKVTAKEKPDIVIVSVHSGVGWGDGKVLESQGLDLYKSLSGVDMLITSHDHRPAVLQSDSLCLINSGSHARNVGHGEIKVTVKDGKVVSKELSAGLIPVKADKADSTMRACFSADYEAVKAFTLRQVGELKTDMITRESYAGQCDYMNLLHRVSIGCSPAKISFAAPLTFNGTVKAGTLIYNDLFTIYPYENQLYVVNMTGEEIKNYLEYSYSSWVQTISNEKEHALNIRAMDDPRTGQVGWSFAGRAYNLDSAAGLNYTVDVTKPVGSRVEITTLADGTPFSLSETYPVAMTSYRASGGGDLLREGAGIDTDAIDERVVSRYPEIRDLIYDYLLEHGSIDPEEIGDPAILGHWSFVPEGLATKSISRDMNLLFGKK